MGNCLRIDSKKPNKDKFIINSQEKIDIKEIKDENNSGLSLNDDNNLSIPEYSINNKSNDFSNEN